MKYIKFFLFIIFLFLLLNTFFSSWNYFSFINPTLKTNKDSYYIIIDLDDNTLNLYKNNTLYNIYPVSSGKYSTPSPLGNWTIISKANWGEGFGGTWMGLNVPWGKYGIHGTDEPWTIGKNLSKGCIRMYNDDAKELKRIIPIGTKVTIFKGPYDAFGDGFRTLKPGDVGSDVYAIQEKLKEIGYYNTWVDGKYGPSMLKAVNKFQKEKKIYITKYISQEFYNELGIILFE